MSIDPDDTADTLNQGGTFYENIQQSLEDMLLGGNQMGGGSGMSYEDPDNL